MPKVDKEFEEQLELDFDKFDDNDEEQFDNITTIIDRIEEDLKNLRDTIDYLHYPVKKDK